MRPVSPFSATATPSYTAYDHPCFKHSGASGEPQRRPLTRPARWRSGGRPRGPRTSRRGRPGPRGPGSAGTQKADFVFGQPAHDHVLAAVYVEHPAQIGAGETLRVAVVAGGSHDAQLQDLPLRDRHRVRRHRHRIHRVGEVVVLAAEDSVDHHPLHVEAPGHDQIAVGGAGALAPQVTGGEERAVGVSDHHHLLVLRLEVLDG